MVSKTLPYIIILLFVIPLIFPLFSRGFFSMHDDTQPARVFEMSKALKDGQFPVRWVGDLGYGFGYPLFNFYAPLPYYFGAIWLLMGINLFIATKIMFALPIILSVFAMYILVKKFSSTGVALFSSILYGYAPYHAVEIYVRGAVGEYWAYAFLPLVFFGILETKKKVQGIIVGSVGFAGLILSHNISGLILLYLLGSWLIIEVLISFLKHKISPYVINICAVTLLGIGLSAFFLIPAISEASQTKVDALKQGSNDFRNHFVYLDQLWDSPWGFAGSASGKNDGMSFKIGKTHLVILGFSSFFLLYQLIIKKRKISRRIFLIMGGLVISIVLLLQISLPLWEFLPYFPFIQYPWRMLLFVNFFLALFVGIASGFVLNKKSKLTLALLLLGVIVVISINAKYFSPQYITLAHNEDYVSDDALRYKISKISDEYTPKYFPIPNSIDEIAKSPISKNNDIIIESVEAKSHWIKAEVTVNKPERIVFSIAYFPGWKFVIDNEQVKPVVVDGLPVFYLQPGRHTLTAYFGSNVPRLVGNLISLLSAFVFIGLVSKLYGKK